MNLNSRSLGSLTLCTFALIACNDGASPPTQATSTLELVQKRGTLLCGVNTGLRGFSFDDGAGTFSGFDVDFCRALAAAVLGDASKVEFKKLTAAQRFPALKQGEIDVLIRNTTWTLSRDTSEGVNFVQTTFYDGQGFLVKKSSGISGLAGLEGKSICVIPGTTTEGNLKDELASKSITFNQVSPADNAAMIASYDSGSCDAMTSDKSGLSGLRTQLSAPGDHEILGVTISKEPLGPGVRHGDDQWFDIVQWVVFATVLGEEHSVSSTNVDQIRSTATSPAVKRLLGLEGSLGDLLGLSADWAYRIIKQVGNYAEIYDRNLGPGTATSIPRAQNSLWSNGGLLYAPPMR